MTVSWYDTSFRKLFFDFHSAGTVKGLAAKFDAERWADRLVAAHAQAVSVFTKCGNGYSYYQKGRIRYRHPHLPEGLDMLGEQIAALHRRGLRAIGYYHTFSSEPIAREHPEWVEKGPDGKPRGGICLLSPLVERWMLPHIEEIVTLYDVDAMFFDGTYPPHHTCACDACRQRFAATSGEANLPTDPKHPAWPAYVVWKQKAFRDLRQAIGDTIHKVRPDVVVSFNWAYTPRQPEAVPEGVGALVADIHPDDQVFGGSYLSAHWAMAGRPFDIMNTAFLQWWGDWGCKPAVAMQQEVAATIAHGGLAWIGYQMRHDFEVEPAVMEQLGQTLAFVRDREPLLRDALPVAHVAVLHSTHAHVAAAEPALFVNELSARGAHRLLSEAMVPHHFVHEATLLSRLAEFRAVILPDQRRLDPPLVAALDAWVNAGGVLVAAGFTGTLDASCRDTGTLALEDLLGVWREGVYDQSHAYIEVTDPRLTPGTLPMPHLAETTFVLARPTAADVQVLASLRRIYLREDGQFLLRWSPAGEDSGYPAITLRPVGRGFAVFIAGDVFRAYQAKNQWNLKHIVANLLRHLIPAPPVTVEAPVWVEVALGRQGQAADRGERLLVHLVNPHGDRPLDGNNRCVERVLPVPNVVVRVPCSRRPSRVTLEPGGIEPRWAYDGGAVSVTVPEVPIHVCVAIER